MASPRRAGDGRSRPQPAKRGRAGASLDGPAPVRPSASMKTPRRLDVIEFLDVADALGADPCELLRGLR